MATATPESCLSEIGETAGVVWRLLDQKGPLTLAKLVKDIDLPRDTIMQALGWLAREDKIDIEENGRTRTVSLR
jgi:DNA-binding transcriptional ArsR family regulator